MSRAVLRDRFGIYLHVPFCSKKCDYCSFATWTDRDHLVEDYLQACKAQAREAASSIRSISSVFIGGGTPNLVPAQLLMDIFDGLPLHPNAEFTVECNPDQVTADDLEIYADHGVNRISLGVQSMVPHVLGSLGREHNPDNVHNSVEIIRNAGIKNLNLDLIYGAQGETLKDWDRSLSEVLALQPDHISAYALTVEAGTPLAKAPERQMTTIKPKSTSWLTTGSLLGVTQTMKSPTGPARAKNVATTFCIGVRANTSVLV